MGKHQYVNRKIDGVKLGQVVAKDLLKRIPPGTGSKAALRDPQVELDISGRGINDEAAAEICDALVKSMSYEKGVTKLEELKLKENALTARCLTHLARVVKAAAHELRDLDLSSNAISIKTPEDADAWETFLLAFRKCIVLRRLDLSGNSLGPKAFERLAKVYAREEKLTARLEAAEWSRSQTNVYIERSLGDRVNRLTLENEDEKERELEQNARTPLGSRSRRESTNSPDKQGATKMTAELMAMYATTSGLRSIPYIILCDCSLTDTCAMYLSYMLEQHPTVGELLPKVPPPRPGDSTRQLEAYDTETICDGIIFTNDKLTEAGQRVLHLSGQARSSGMPDNSDDGHEEAAGDSPLVKARKTSDTPATITPTSMRTRRGSMSVVSPFPATPSVLRANQIHTARSRIEGNIIRDAGPQSNDLWHAALRMLAITRPLLSAPTPTQVTDLVAGLEHEQQATTPPAKWTDFGDILKDRTNLEPSPNMAFTGKGNACGGGLKGKTNVRHPARQPPLSWPEIVTKHPDAVESKVTRKPAVLRLGVNRHGQHTLEPESPLTLTLPENNFLAPGVHQLTPPKTPLKLPEKAYRSKLLGGLNEQIWGKIIGYAVKAGDNLSEEQNIKVIGYGSDRATLQTELECLGKPDNTQIWRALEGMGCLEYV